MSRSRPATMRRPSSYSSSTRSRTASSDRGTAARRPSERDERLPGASERSAAGRARVASTSRSRTHLTSCRSSPARSGFLPRMHSTTNSHARSTRSAAGQRVASSFQMRFRRTGSTGSARPRRRCGGFPGLKEEYYLAGFSPGRVGARRAGDRSRHDSRDRPHAAGGVALPPSRQSALRRPPSRSRRRLRGASGRPTANTKPAARRHGARLARPRGPRARARRAESRGAGGSRYLGRRDDEPRGSGARSPCLHDVRRSYRRGRRAADSRGEARAPYGARRGSPREAGGHEPSRRAGSRPPARLLLTALEP